MIAIRRKVQTDGLLFAQAWRERYGSSRIVSRGQARDAASLQGLVAEDGGAVVGVVTWAQEGGRFEIVTLDSFVEDHGVGTALLDAAVAEARKKGAHRAWLVTTNDNIRALRFYQRRGWNMAALHRGAVDEARKLKPEIPATGADGIPIRHEIEFELRLA
ncbi:MAG TPA: GNAT family N-acetyltransferase [Rhizomicrobium sp.]|nr:GNAT family N-acetyltransferase [Rhizomicrobium sp.]